MTMKNKIKAQVIPPDAYPQMVTKAQAEGITRVLRSNVTAVTASRVIEETFLIVLPRILGLVRSNLKVSPSQISIPSVGERCLPGL